MKSSVRMHSYIRQYQASQVSHIWGYLTLTGMDTFHVCLQLNVSHAHTHISCNFDKPFMSVCSSMCLTDTHVSCNFDKPFMSVCSSMSLMDTHVSCNFDKPSCLSAAQCLSWTHTSHATLTNLSCPSVLQLNVSHSHKPKADTPLVESMHSFPVLMRTRLRRHSSSQDSYCEH